MPYKFNIDTWVWHFLILKHGVHALLAGGPKLNGAVNGQVNGDGEHGEHGEDEQEDEEAPLNILQGTDWESVNYKVEQVRIYIYIYT